MKKSTQIFWVDAGLAGLLPVTLLMVVPEIFSHAFVHVLPGLLLMAVAGLHLWLHRDWITVALRNFRKMSRQAQQNALLDLALFGAYFLCGGVGLSARLMLFISPIHHIFLGIIHVILTLLLLGLQTLHIARHFKWIKANVRARLFLGQHA